MAVTTEAAVAARRRWIVDVCADLVSYPKAWLDRLALNGDGGDREWTHPERRLVRASDGRSVEREQVGSFLRRHYLTTLSRTRALVASSFSKLFALSGVLAESRDRLLLLAFVLLLIRWGFARSTLAVVFRRSACDLFTPLSCSMRTTILRPRCCRKGKTAF